VLAVQEHPELAVTPTVRVVPAAVVMTGFGDTEYVHGVRTAIVKIVQDPLSALAYQVPACV